jgi:4-diphosphocytidyl-2-C-methyl-D-erythritol kinase
VTERTAERDAFAPAKINLTLRIVRKRPDGYHDLESLVVFADVGDTLRLVPGPSLGLTVEGPTAAQAGPDDDNLVIRVARGLAAQIANLRAGHFHLTKATPVAAGLGGGSSDAAAALRLLAALNAVPLHDPRIAQVARATGADIPVCLDPKPRIMRGIGDILSDPIALPPLPAVLVNPGVPVPTGPVFKALAQSRGDTPPPAIENDAASRIVASASAPSFDRLIEALVASSNDLEAPAIAGFPAVAETLAALRATRRCRLARMSGSGGTCFGLFATAEDAKEAAARLTREHPHWWVRSATLGSGLSQ